MLTRRDLLKSSAVAGAGCSSPALSTVSASRSRRSPSPTVTDRSSPTPAGLLDLPTGFRYDVVTQAGRPLAGAVSGTVPGRPDGTASFPGPKGGAVPGQQPRAEHRRRRSRTVAAASLTYDPACAGAAPRRSWSTATAAGRRVRQPRRHVHQLRRRRHPVGHLAHLRGDRGQAGANGMTKDHGYVFEVDPRPTGAPTATRRRSRRSAASRTRPSSSTPSAATLYLTEDASDPNGLLYRWTPPHGFQHGRGGCDARRRRGCSRRCASTRRPLRRRPLPRSRRSAPRYRCDWKAVPDRDAQPDVDLASSSPDGGSPAAASSRACGGATAARTSCARSPG